MKQELKRAFCSRPFWVTCGITLAMPAFGSSDYLLPVFYPIVVMIPYVLSYRRDRDSGGTGIVPGRGSSCLQSLRQNAKKTTACKFNC